MRRPSKARSRGDVGAVRSTDLACILGACTIALPVVFSTARNAIGAAVVDVGGEIACAATTGAGCLSQGGAPAAAIDTLRLLRTAEHAASTGGASRTTSARKSVAPADLAVSEGQPLDDRERALKAKLPAGHLLAIHGDQRFQGPIEFHLGARSGDMRNGYYLRLASDGSHHNLSPIPAAEGPFFLMDSAGNKVSSVPPALFRAKSGERYLRLESANGPLVSPARQRALKEAAVQALPDETRRAVHAILGARPLNPALPGDVADYRLAAATAWQFLKDRGANDTDATRWTSQLMRSVYVLPEGSAFISDDGVGYTNRHVVGDARKLPGGNWFGTTSFEVARSNADHTRLDNDVALLLAAHAPKDGLPLASHRRFGKPAAGEAVLLLGFPAHNGGRGPIARVGVPVGMTTALSEGVTDFEFPHGPYLGASGSPVIAFRPEHGGLVITAMVTAASQTGLVFGPTGERVGTLSRQIARQR